jgi:antitoxin HicB
MKTIKYSIVIQWSEEDQIYVVTLPEWQGAHTHGKTYEEAAKNAQEVLELLMSNEKSVPVPHEFAYPGPTGFTYDLTMPPAKAKPKRKQHVTA